MRQLWIMTGAPGSGKSYWLNSCNLSQYAICADDIRLLHQTPVLNINGELGISQSNDNKVWETLFFLLEQRMARGEFTIIDACHSKTSDFTHYKKLAENYRYRLFSVSFRDVPKELNYAWSSSFEAS